LTNKILNAKSDGNNIASGGVSAATKKQGGAADEAMDEEQIVVSSSTSSAKDGVAGQFAVGIRCLNATWNNDDHWYWDTGMEMDAGGNRKYTMKQEITVCVATLQSDIWIFKLGPDNAEGCSTSHESVDQNVSEAMKGHYEQVQALAPHPSVPFCFATGGFDQNLVVWDGRVTKKSVWECGVPGKISTIDFRPPEGDDIAVGLVGGELIILNAELCAAGEENSSTWLKIKHHDMWLEDLKYSPDARFLAVSSHDQTIDLYKCDMDYLHHRRLSGHGAFVTHLDWSKDSLTLQSCDGGGELLYWNAPTGSQITSRYDSTEADTEWDEYTCVIGFPVMGIWQDGDSLNDINSLHRSDDENYIVTAGDDGMVRLFNCPCVVEDAPSRAYTGHAAHVSQVRFLLNDEACVTTGSVDLAVMQWKFFPRGRKKAAFEDDELAQMTLLANTGMDASSTSVKPPAKFGRNFDPLGTRTTWKGDEFSVWK
jgi:WD40 repeat protein